ncbi:MAG: DegT/DnrJ/EryC1/StrS family aminotransferase, partial [Armatimonadetes bacterium]|nr:DegT/DnrJ/EryC1/StrS family aminotransferase [Armatimonadota bacterium]
MTNTIQAGSPLVTEKIAQPVPLLDLKAQYAEIREEIAAAIQRVLDSQRFILGPEVEAFEKQIAEYCQCRCAIGVSSGTDALLIALMTLGIDHGDEVITPSHTFFATAGGVARLGAKPVCVDVDPWSFNLDPTKLEAAITSRTRAIIPVHLYGQTADMARITEIAERHHLPVVEDAAQAIGAEYHGKRAGSLGTFGCLSFFPSKNLGGYGDGGMVVTNDEELADRVRLLRTQGYRPKYYNKAVGGNFRLDPLQAAVLAAKLPHLDAWTAARQRNAGTYRKLFAETGLEIDGWNGESVAGVKGIVQPADMGFGRHVYNQFVIRAGFRDELMAWLKQHNIGSEIYYPVPVHLQECFAALGY